ncbi:MAG: queuosine precursor transporter [Gammaproteobacteria bacterium]|nr:queuosine precursor transporter [Gammaproteobacteria bacterium]
MKKIYINELLWAALIIANFSLTLVAFRIWGKLGLFVFAILSIILANIQALKQVDLFGLHGSMGDISYIGVYLISDILSENYGKETAKKLIWLGMFSVLAVTIIMYLSLKLIPSEYDQAQNALSNIFAIFPRFVVASLCAFFVSQSYDVIAYQFWRKKFPAYRYIWLRNGMSTMVSQLIDNAIFTLIAFLGKFPLNYVIEIFITSCILRTIISIVDTPFIYWSVAIKNKVVEA